MNLISGDIATIRSPAYRSLPKTIATYASTDGSIVARLLQDLLTGSLALRDARKRQEYPTAVHLGPLKESDGVLTPTANIWEVRGE